MQPVVLSIGVLSHCIYGYHIPIGSQPPCGGFFIINSQTKEVQTGLDYHGLLDELKKANVYKGSLVFEKLDYNESNLPGCAEIRKSASVVSEEDSAGEE